jgi:hypothetical protein
MNNTILQIPMSKTLRDQALEAATDLGFSSLQEYIRVMLTKTAKGQTTVSINSLDETTLSPQAAARYDKMVNEVQSGKVKPEVFDKVDDLMQYLNS